VLGIFWASYVHCPDELGYRYRAAGDPERWTSAHDAIDHARDGPRGLIAPSGAAALLPRTWPPEPTSPLLHGPCAPRTPCSCLLASFTSSQTPSAQDDEMSIGTSWACAPQVRRRGVLVLHADDGRRRARLPACDRGWAAPRIQLERGRASNAGLGTKRSSRSPWSAKDVRWRAARL